jgi:glycosyltransferase 2 family protein
MGKKIKSLVILLIGGLLAWWFVSRLDWVSVGTHLRQVRIWPLVIACILINLTMLFRSLRWQAFLAPSARVGLRNLFAATSIGFGALFALGRAGEILRPAVLSMHERLRPSLTIATIFIERIYDAAAVVLLFSISLIFVSTSGDDQNQGRFELLRTIGALMSIGLLTGIGLLILLRLRARQVIQLLEARALPFAPRLLRPLINFVRHLTEGLSVLTNLRELALTIIYTVIVWSFIIAANWITFDAFGLDFGPAQVVFTLGFGLVGSLVPTPGGSAGAYHAAAARGLEFLGLDPNLAASIAIINHLIGFGPPFLLGLYFLVRDDLSLARIREIFASEVDG